MALLCFKFVSINFWAKTKKFWAKPDQENQLQFRFPYTSEILLYYIWSFQRQAASRKITELTWQLLHRYRSPLSHPPVHLSGISTTLPSLGWDGAFAITGPARGTKLVEWANFLFTATSSFRSDWFGSTFCTRVLHGMQEAVLSTYTGVRLIANVSNNISGSVVFYWAIDFITHDKGLPFTTESIQIRFYPSSWKGW